MNSNQFEVIGRQILAGKKNRKNSGTNGLKAGVQAVKTCGNRGPERDYSFYTELYSSRKQQLLKPK
ncbi:hypothetical protein [Neobacillus kokaensis]|uniref:hypothetical protein n=1 Tax=Neobacillus kokaensis TaxID=2759023 RepID=UPI00174A1E0C|nr:hypothetical protein [Neobacillus kokaensis]